MSAAKVSRAESLAMFIMVLRGGGFVESKVLKIDNVLKLCGATAYINAGFITAMRSTPFGQEIVCDFAELAVFGA